MPLTAPPSTTAATRSSCDETLARIPVHTPEWTNFNESDPGVTLVELFAFLTESLLYRANQIPERNRRKFLQLLGVPLAPARAARGLVAVRATSAARCGRQTLPPELEVRAGEVPFRTERGLDVLPIEARVFVKRKLADAVRPSCATTTELLYASCQATLPRPTLRALRDRALDGRSTSVDLGARHGRPLALDRAAGAQDADAADRAQAAIGGRTLSSAWCRACDDAPTRTLGAARPGRKSARAARRVARAPTRCRRRVPTRCRRCGSRAARRATGCRPRAQPTTTC